MATRQDIIDQITANVEIVETTERDLVLAGQKAKLADGTRVEDQAIPVRYISDAEGTLKFEKQKITVHYDSNGTDIEAWFAAKQLKNYEAPADAQADLLARFVEIETEAGGEVKVDPAHLDKLGVKYLVFEENGVKKVSATVAGQNIVREAL